MLTSVGHGEVTGFFMLELEVLVREFIGLEIGRKRRWFSTSTLFQNDCQTQRKEKFEDYEHCHE